MSDTDRDPDINAQLIRLLLYLFVRTDERPPPGESESATAIDLARTLDLEGALYAALRRRGHTQHVPEDTLRRLRRVHVEFAAHNLELVRAYVEIRDAFMRSGLEARALKGIALIEAGVIENLGSRYCLDLDILVHPGNRAATTREMERLGYVTSGVGGAPKHLPEFRRGGVVVEIHELAFWNRAGKKWGLVELGREPEPLAFVIAHLVHHLHVSSVTEPRLAAKTIADFVALRSFARDRSELSQRARVLCHELALGRQLEALIRAADTLLSDEPFDPQAASVLALCETPTQAQRLLRFIGYYVRGIAASPAWFRREMLASIFLPNRETMASIYKIDARSPWILAAYGLRPIHLSYALASRLLGAMRGDGQRGVSHRRDARDYADRDQRGRP